MSLVIRGKEFDFSSHKYCMGIINVTPDSFFEGSRVKLDDLINVVSKMIQDEVDIIDIGGESTRPGSDPVNLEEELRRVIPAIREIRKNFPNIPISVDTYKSQVAKQAIENGADIVNDISAGTFDQDMIRVIRDYNVPIILMHIKGTPKSMQDNPEYKDVVREITEFLRERIEKFESFGVDPSKIIIDPGIGFGKKLEHNISIIRRLAELKQLKKPILVGLSRKSIVGGILNVPIEERLTGTIALNTVALMNGASIIRVHDVKEGKQTCKIVEVLYRGSL
ncbi:MAG: dihydropteroate synthase [Brevinematia bacterium]